MDEQPIKIGEEFFIQYARGQPLLTSVHLETALFRRGCVNLRACLCDVKYYASAQALDFLVTTQNCSFPI